MHLQFRGAALMAIFHCCRCHLSPQRGDEVFLFFVLAILKALNNLIKLNQSETKANQTETLDSSSDTSAALLA